MVMHGRGTDLKRIVLLNCSLLLAGIASAHHAAIEYGDAERVIEGEVLAISWRNPHVTLSLKTSNGETWRLEGGPANLYARFDITRDAVSVGDQVRVTGNPSASGRNRLWFSSISRGDQTVVFGEFAAEYSFSNQGDELTDDKASGIFRVWNWRLQGRPTWPRDLPLRESAIAARDAWNSDDDPVHDCIAPGMPRAMTQNPYAIEFVQSDDDTILLYLTEFDSVRTIHMDGSPPPPGAASTPLGYSVGWWGEEELVVRTTSIDYPLFDRTGIPQSPSVEIFERFSVSADESELRYQITLEDPETLTEPIQGSKLWAWIPGRERLPYDCAIPDF